MSRTRIVKGTYTKITGGNHNMYAKGNIVTTAGKSITELGKENGISYGEPEKPPKKQSPTRVKEIELLTALDDGSANDGSGGTQKGFIFGKTYQFKVKSFTKDKPISNQLIHWSYKYHNLSTNKWVEVKSKLRGEAYSLHFNEAEMCGRFISVRAYIDDDEAEGELKKWHHNRFRWFDRKQLKEEVEERKNKPYLANQNETPTCGMAAIFYLLAKKDFDKYKDFVLQLHQKGIAKCNDYKFDVTEKSIHLLEMNPLTNKKYPNYHGKMPYCDWIAFSCIRDKENGVRNYNGENDESFDGSTVPRELVKLMREILNFKSVVDYTNVIFNKGTLLWDGEDSTSREVAKMQELYLKGYAIIMLINTNMLSRRKSGVISAIEHWVVFERIIGGTRSWDEYGFKVFTWGEIRDVIINPEVFSSNFYGYVYGK